MVKMGWRGITSLGERHSRDIVGWKRDLLGTPHRTVRLWYEEYPSKDFLSFLTKFNVPGTLSICALHRLSQTWIDRCTGVDGVYVSGKFVILLMEMLPNQKC
jgi:hypothetical protein